MSAALGQPIARQLTQTSSYLRAEFGFGNATEIAELFRALAVTCVEKQVTRVLVVAGDDEPTGERALRDALTTMILAGIPEDFRLALVTTLPRVARAYGNAQRDLNMAGVTTRLFDNEEDAVQWLDGARQAA